MTTRSKLGGVYDTSAIQAMDKQAHATLKELRSLPGNTECAECRASPSTWASVSLGVFVCMDCAQVHRNLGAHISKVKSCMGTYLWCPDELERMKAIGNERAWALYTGGAPRGTVISKPADGAPFELRDRHARDKYEKKTWLHPGGMEAVIAEERLRPAQAPAKAARAPRAAAAARGSSAKARRDARSKVAAMRRGGGGASAAAGTGAAEDTRLMAADDEWAGAEWDSWSPQPRPPASRDRTCPPASAPAPAPAALAPPVVAAPPAVDTFDAFFRECVGGQQQAARRSSGGGGGGGGGGSSSTDLIDLFSPAPAVTSGLLARQVSAH